MTSTQSRRPRRNAFHPVVCKHDEMREREKRRIGVGLKRSMSHRSKSEQNGARAEAQTAAARRSASSKPRHLLRQTLKMPFRQPSPVGAAAGFPLPSLPSCGSAPLPMRSSRLLLPDASRQLSFFLVLIYTCKISGACGLLAAPSCLRRRAAFLEAFFLYFNCIRYSSAGRTSTSLLQLASV